MLLYKIELGDLDLLKVCCSIAMHKNAGKYIKTLKVR